MKRFIDSMDFDAAAIAAGVLADGGLIVIPTDTVYGLAARIDRPHAIERLFKAKERMRVKPVAVLAANLEQARSLALFDEAATRMATQWPGALTLVLVRRAEHAALDLGADASSIGIRVPDHQLVREILLASGPVAASSANPAGVSTPSSCAQIARHFGDTVDLYIDGGEVVGLPSRVVSLIDGAKILRDQ